MYIYGHYILTLLLLCTGLLTCLTGLYSLYMSVHMHVYREEVVERGGVWSSK